MNNLANQTGTRGDLPFPLSHTLTPLLLSLTYRKRNTISHLIYYYLLKADGRIAGVIIPTQEVNQVKTIIGIIIFALVLGVYLFITIKNHRKK